LGSSTLPSACGPGASKDGAVGRPVRAVLVGEKTGSSLVEEQAVSRAANAAPKQR